MAVTTKLLIQLRKAVNLSQTAAADRLGISRMELYRIESGKKDLPLSLVFRMLHVYHVLPNKICVNDLYEIYPGSFKRFASWSMTDFRKNHPKPVVQGTPDPGSTKQGASDHTDNTDADIYDDAEVDGYDDMPP